MYRHFHRDWFALAKSVWFWARQKKTKPILFAFCDWIKGSELLVTGYPNNNSIGSLGVWFYAVIHLTPLSNCNRDKMEYNYFQLSPVLFVTVHNVDYTLFTRRPVTDVCVCVTSIELPIFRALTIESNTMGKLKMSETFEHIKLFRNACKSETVDFSLFERVFQFWVFVCASNGHCPFVCVFMKHWATHFNLSIPLWINRFQLWWLISNTLWMSCELKIRTCAWMFK